MITVGNAPSDEIGAVAAIAAAQATRAPLVDGDLRILLPGAAGFISVLPTAIHLEDQTNTDLPAGIRDAEGWSAMIGSFTLAGTIRKQANLAASIDAFDLFDPDNAASPIYRQRVKGAPVQFDGGVPGNLVRKFTGRVTTYSLDPVARTVQFQLVDLATDWDQALPTLSGVVTAPPYNAGLTNEYVMDAAIRSEEGYSMWPAQRPECLLAVGMRASIACEIGTFLGIVGGPANFVPGVYGSCYAPNTTADNGINVYTPYTLAAAANDDVQVEFIASGLVARAGSALQIVLLPAGRDGNGVLTVAVTATQLTVKVAYPTSADTYTATLPSADAHEVTVHVHWPAGSSTWFAEAQIDGTVYNSGPRTFGIGRPEPLIEVNLVSAAGPAYGLTAGIEAFQITGETALASSFPFTPNAVMDPSLNPLQVVPVFSAPDTTWDVLQQAAASELGRAWRDRFGTFRFLNRLSIAKQGVQATISSDLNLKTYGTDVGAGTEYGSVQIPYTAWKFSTPQNAWTLADTGWVVPGGQTRSWTQKLPDLVANLDTTVTKLPNGHDTNDGGSYYRASSDPAGLNEHPGVTVTLEQTAADTVVITIDNTRSHLSAYMISPANYTDITVASPAVWLGGILVTPADSTTVTVGDGKTVYTASTNPFWQDRDAVEQVAWWVLAQLSTAIRDFTNISIVPNWLLETGDFDSLQAAPTGLDEYVYLWGWVLDASFTRGSETLDMTVNARAAGPPGAWLAGIPGRSEAGVTTYVYSGGS